MVQKVVIVKDGTEQNPVPLDMGSSGSLGVQVKGIRSLAAGCTAHRTALTYGDLIGPVTLGATNIPLNQIAPTTVQGAGFADGGAGGNLGAASHIGAYAIRNGMGVTMASGLGTVTPTASHYIRMTIPAAWGSSLTLGADVYYEIFTSLATDVTPKHVATFTAAQLAAGGCIVTTVETPLVNGAAGAWAVDIGVLGTGMQSGTAPFAQSTAYLTTPTAVNTAGYNNVDVFVDVSVTSLGVTTQPALTLLPVFLDDKGGVNYHVGAPMTPSIEGGVGLAKRMVYNLTTNGASVIILVASITNVTVNRIDIVPTSVV